MSSEFVNIEGVSKDNEIWEYQYRGWFQSTMRRQFNSIESVLKHSEI